MTFLEQFEAFKKEAIIELGEVVSQGLTAIENDALIALAGELIKLAQKHDQEALSKVATYIQTH